MKNNAVLYYSNTTQSFKVASYLSSISGYPLIDLRTIQKENYENIFVVFPVHSQNIPKQVKEVLYKIKCLKAIFIITYGKMSYGNILYEIQRKYNFNIVGGAYIPTKHTYIKEDNEFCEYSRLDQLLDRFSSNNYIKFPKLFKNPFSDFFPTLRSRIGVKIIRNKNCINCNSCNLECSYINNGKTNRKCIRCLRCVNNCKCKQLDFKLNCFMKLYLSKKKKNNLIIY